MKWVLLVLTYAVFVLPFALIILAAIYVGVKEAISNPIDRWLDRHGIGGGWKKLLVGACTLLFVILLLCLFLLTGPDQHRRVW